MFKICNAFFFLFFLSLLVYAQDQNIKFEHLSTQNGFSSDWVTTILQDHQGIMWFGTVDGGLNKYDGYKITVYKNIPGDSTSLTVNRIHYLYEDSSGCLWIGTKNGGLCRFNRDTDNFTRYLPKKNDISSLSCVTVESIFEAKMNGQNILWVGGVSGLNRYNPDTDSFKRYYPETNKEGLKTNVNVVYSIVQDSSNRIWIGMVNEGLFYFDPDADRFIRFKAKKEYSKIFKNKYIYRLHASMEGSKDVLWIGVYDKFLYKIYTENGQIKHYLPEPVNLGRGYKSSVYAIHPENGSAGKALWLGIASDGICRFDIKREEFNHFRHNPRNLTSLSSNEIWDIKQDKSGVLWIATGGGCVNKVNLQQSNFTAFKPNSDMRNNLNVEGVRSFCESQSENRKYLWIATEDGLYKYVRETGTFTHFKHDPANKNSLTSDHISALIISKYTDRKFLWAGTQKGLNKIDMNTGRIKRFYTPSENFVHNNILSLCEDEKGHIWVGTFGSFLYSFDPQSEKFTLHAPPRGHLYCLYYDFYGNLWTGSGAGLEKFHLKTGKSIRYKNHQNDSTSISNNTITTIYGDNNKNIWVGTTSGLNKYDRVTETFSQFSEKDGLPSDVIVGILEDDNGCLWISSGKGLSRFNPINKSVKNFDVRDGLHGNGMISGSAYKNEAGEMFFGGPKGFTVFHPDKIKENKFIPPIIISDFKIFNQRVQPGINSILKKQISDTRKITLPYDQSVFSFEFAALDYHNPQKNQYAYQMEGVDPQWVFTDASRRFATYTNLDPGDYAFKVKGSNNDGLWNEEGTSIKVTILPPWWRTNLAYAAYILLFTFTLYALRTYNQKRQHLKQELEMEHFKADKLREIDKLKTNFFANISHEFRTPLTLIKGPVKQMLEENFIGNVKEQYKMILRNSDRLFGLINQILDLSKLESGGMKLEISKTDVIKYLKGLVFSFSSLAEQKKIKLSFKSEMKSIIGYVDHDKLEKIITNLLSNALKFTPEGGKIEVELLKELVPNSSRGGSLQISISNTGPGISVERIDKIFDRFYQADNNYKKDGEGTGIGLALTKELVDVCRGEISVSSELNNITTFTLRIPIDKEYFKSEEISEIKETGGRKPNTGIQIPQESTEENVQQSDRSPASGLRSPLLLIVEDNPDVTCYICSFLENDFRIITADNGRIGLKKTLDKFPDLIISDVMMPKMDGFEMCRKIKSDERISHIPVILLTAKADLDSKIEGLEFGADDYISKPFEADELKVRSKNLIEQRRKLREKYIRLIDLQPENISVSSMDEKLLQRLLTIFEDHIEEPEFSTENLAHEIGMSRMHLNRKLRALTNQSTNEFIRTLRLKRAAQLLKKRAGNVSEVAYKVGFNNVSHFAKVFRKQFGQTPSKFSSTNN